MQRTINTARFLHAMAMLSCEQQLIGITVFGRILAGPVHSPDSRDLAVMQSKFYTSQLMTAHVISIFRRRVYMFYVGIAIP